MQFLKIFSLIILVSLLLSCEDLSPPPAPDTPVATTGDGQVTLSWNQMLEADTYNIYYSSSPITQLSSANKLSTNALSQQITGLTNGTKYYFVVTAVKTIDNIESEQSIQIEAMPMPKPALANLSPLSFYHGNPATITFTNTGGTANNCTATPTLPIGLNIATHSDTCRITGTTTGLTTATTYTIKATNTTGFNSATINIKIILKAPIATVVTDDKKITLAWNSVSGADKYHIYYSNNPITQLSSASKLSTNALNQQITGLTNGTTYYFVVTAVKIKITGNIESQQSTQIVTTPASKPVLANLPALSFYHGTPATITFTNTGGTASNCTATPTLPAGLNIATHSGTCRITGTTTDLTTATTYTIKAINTTGFNTATVNIKVILKAPIATVVTDDKKITLAWHSVSGADKYNIYYSSSPITQLSSASKLSTNALNQQITSLTNNTKYYFVVTAVKTKITGNIESQQSIQLEATPVSKPALANLSPLSLYHGDPVTITFINTGGTASNCTTTPTLPTGLNIATHSGTCRITGTTTGLTTATTYTIKATNTTGFNSATVNIKVILKAPVVTIVATDDKKITLAWSSISGADKYNIYYSSSSITQLSSVSKLSTNALNQQITGLTNSTKYYFVVTAVKTTGNIESQQSTQIAATPVSTPALANLSALSFYHGDPVTITFTNTGSAASNCTATPTLPTGLNIATHSGTCRITGTTTGLTTATTYTIKATNTTGFNSATVNIKVILKAPIATVVTDDKKITLAWHSVSGADKYNIYYSSSPITQLSSASKLSTNALNQQITGLTNGTKYYFVVTAVKTTGNIESQQSTQIEATPVSTPALANLSALSFYHGDPVTITFTNTGGTTSNCTATPALPTGLNIATHSGTCRITGTTTGLAIATTYTIKATNTTGFNTVTVNIKVILKAPVATVVTDDKKITLAWDSVSGADKYNVYYSSNPITQLSSASKLSTSTLNQQITGLTNNTKYYFVVTALKIKTTGNIESQQSTQIEAIPVSKPALANLPSLSFYYDEPATITFTNTGGTTSNCTVTPTLPTGLNIATHSGTCRITGTTTGLAIATTYTIKATNTTGFNTATVNIKVILKAPVATVVAGNQKIILFWDGVSGADKYNIYYAEQTFANIKLSNYASLTGGTLIPNLTESSKEIALTNGTQYYFVLTASKDGKESGASNEINSVPIALNDTGITWGGNYPTGNNTNCTGTTISAQDCKHGRDAKAAANTLIKIGAGSAGFDFTKLDSNGNTLAASATDWRCVKDNHTGLIWEVKTTNGLHNKNDTYTWYNTDDVINGGAGYADKEGDTCHGYSSSDNNTFCNTQAFVNRVNTVGLCGKDDWHLSTINELRSIADYGRLNPSIDIDYFPNTPADYFWTSSPHSKRLSNTWIINFGYGNDGNSPRYYSYRLRLVRSGI